jgi:acyl-CoA thioester hydrolase
MAPIDRFVSQNTFYVRYAETDAMGIVHHSSYVVYLEEGRSHYARTRGHSYAEIEASGYILVVAEINLRYLKSAHYDDQLTVKTWLDSAKSRGVVFQYEVINANTGDLLVTATTRHICLTREGQVTHLPVQWREWGNT